MYLIINVLYVYALLIFSNSLKMIKTDRNMSEFWHFACKEYINISAFCGFIVWIMCMYYDSIKL